MSTTRAHYAEIYNFDDRGPRWSQQDQRWVYYEGYGQRYCREKMDFLESINVDHPLWSSEGYGLGRNTVGKGGDPVVKSLMFNEESEVKVVGENEVITELIDSSDRHEKTSWNFGLMLANFVEKCSKGDRPSFFKGGFYGEKWTKNEELLKDFKRIFDWIDHMKAIDEKKNISLSDHSVKNYPKHYYDQISSLYKVYMEEKFGINWWKKDTVEVEEKEEKKSFKFNPNAAVFVPRVIFSPALEKEYLPKPLGAAPGKTRPRSTARPDHLLPWKLYEESDKKLLELDRKIQMLINLHGPVVEAEQI